jgi:hypothetical protein
LAKAHDRKEGRSGFGGIAGTKLISIAA